MLGLYSVNYRESVFQLILILQCQTTVYSSGDFLVIIDSKPDILCMCPEKQGIIAYKVSLLSLASED